MGPDAQGRREASGGGMTGWGYAGPDGRDSRRGRSRRRGGSVDDILERAPPPAPPALRAGADTPERHRRAPPRALPPAAPKGSLMTRWHSRSALRSWQFALPTTGLVDIGFGLACDSGAHLSGVIVCQFLRYVHS
jgi:hypothetical protein